jgi:hypothetical protein
MEKNKILAEVADTVIAKAIEFEITIQPRNWLHRWLQEKNLRPTKKRFSIRPIVLGSLLRISKLLLTVDTRNLQKISLDVFHRFVDGNVETCIEVLAIAVHNCRTEPPRSLKNLLRDNVTPAELAKLLQLVLHQMDLRNFTNAIISIRGLSVLDNDEPKKSENEVSPMTGRS